ncbi:MULTISPECIES: hypothetical protein [unclassified Pannonibacter]|uniref:hypothetical protein n=1 Tax=unclassified Pannonibacter TaxID=2627228 RepID=UPI001644C7CE|nr:MULTISPECIES: hypothetical protein [unclassified Pannonibacter]
MADARLSGSNELKPTLNSGNNTLSDLLLGKQLAEHWGYLQECHQLLAADFSGCTEQMQALGTIIA